PHIFVHLEEMPLTSSGKINRNALPETELENIQTGVEYVAPETEKEKALTECIGEILNAEKVSILDNFFDLGGDSLKAIELTARLEAKGYSVSVKTIFSSKDIKSLAEALTSKETEHIKIEYGNVLPATAAQMRVYTSQFVAPDSAHYNVPIAFKVKNLEPEKLSKAVNGLIEKHESLRTRFETRNGEVTQIIEDNAKVKVEKLSSDDISLFNTPFDLTKAPLIKVGYFENTVMLVLHHIIVDGESMGVLLRDLNELYMERDASETVQYGEFAVTDGYTQKNEEYWTGVFSEEASPIELKKDFTRPEKQSFKGSQIYELIDIGLHNRIAEACKRLNITSFVFYMACYNILLSVFSGSEDIVVGTPMNGRDSRFLNSIGMFVNTVALRSKPNSSKKISELLSEIKKASIEAIDNQQYPFDKLVKKLGLNTLGRNPLFDVMFAYQGEQLSEVVFGDEEAEVLPVPLAGVKCDMNFNIITRKTDVVLMVEYSTDLFKEKTVKEFITAYKIILEQALDENKCIGDIDIVSYEDKKKVLCDFNNTKYSFSIPENSTLYSLFEKTASYNKDRICIKTAERNLTFGELLSISESLDTKLRKITGKKKSVIAVIAERSVEMYCAIYGIIRGGNAYLPIDPNYPQERIDRILSDSKAAAVAAQGKFTKLAGNVPVIDMTEFISDCHKESDSEKCAAEPDDTAYVIYTSGSTGNPKGAMVSHRSAVNRILWMHDKYPLGDGDVILQKTPYTFDVSVWELFWWGICGGSLAASKPDEHFLPAKILDEVKSNKVTHLHFVPSVFEIFLSYLESHTEEQSKFNTVKYVFVSGEALTANLVERFYKLYSYDKVTLHNLYGP
ncbi:MAG: AMP-binding protein, partial [Clostridia bacterium]|nr:AMP-binding protein [Clostridia bacterium]